MFTLNCKGRLLVVDKPIIMGIINLTPDSFYAGSRFNETDAVLHQAEKMLNEDADILDIGAQSTRPGSERVSSDDDATGNRVELRLRDRCGGQTADNQVAIDTVHGREVVQLGLRSEGDDSC